MTDTRWLEGLEPGQDFENAAYCDVGAYLGGMGESFPGMPFWFAGNESVAPGDVLRDEAVTAQLEAAGCI